MIHNEEWVNLIIITKKSHKKDIVQMLYDQEAAMVIQAYAYGSATDGILRALGLTRDEKKLFLSCFIAESKVEKVFNYLNTNFKFHAANTGFAFTIPVEKISY